MCVILYKDILLMSYHFFVSFFFFVVVVFFVFIVPLLCAHYEQTAFLFCSASKTAYRDIAIVKFRK